MTIPPRSQLRHQIPPLKENFWSKKTFQLVQKKGKAVTNHLFLHMDIPQRDIATAEAAKLVLQGLERALRDTNALKKLLQAALIPVFGIRWDAQVIGRVTRGRLCEILRLLRNSKLDPVNYRRVSLLWHSASETYIDFPSGWEP